LWDIASARPVHHFEAHKGPIVSVSYSVDGKLLATGSAQGGVAVWDPRTGKQQCSFIRDSNGRSSASATIASISPDGKYLASANGNAIRLWDVATGRERADLARHPLAVRTCTFSADNKEVWTSCGEPYYPRGDHVLRCWDTASGKLTRQIALPEEEWIFAVSDDAKLVLTGVPGQGDDVHLWNADSRKRLHALAGHRHGVTRAAFSRDGKLLAVADCDSGGPVMSGMVHVWNVSTGKELHQLTWDREKTPCWALSFSDDGKLLACGGDGGLWLWDSTRGKLLWESRNNKAYVQAVAFSPDGSLVAALYEHSLDVFEVASGKIILSQALKMAGRAIAFAPDGRTLLLGFRGLRGTIHFLDVGTGEVFAKLSGHEGDINQFAFSPNSKVLASAGADAAVFLWDTASLKPPALAASKLSADDLNRLWTDLSAVDAVTAHRAIWKYLASSDAAVLTIRGKLKPAIVDDKRVQKLIQELDDQSFRVRNGAAAELEALGELAVDALRKAAGVTKSPEVQRRLKELLGRLEPFPLSGERLRALRAIRILEQIGTPAAREVLARMASGAAMARATIAAKASLERLKPGQGTKASN
jgi:WD40 repeat protein